MRRAVFTQIANDTVSFRDDNRKAFDICAHFIGLHFTSDNPSQERNGGQIVWTEQHKEIQI